MRAIVTGGAGFVGSHLIEALLSRGADVVCIEPPGSTPGWIDGLPVGFADCGISDRACLEHVFRRADVIYHVAAVLQARDPAEFDRVNAQGTANVLEAAARQPKIPRVVFASSIAALGPCRNGERLNGESVPHPLSHYGQSKLAAESVVHAYADRVPTVILRFSSIYGPRERAVLQLFRMVRHGIALTVGGWDREVSLLYVADAVDALLAAGCAPGAPGHAYCIAHPDAVSWSRFAQCVGSAVGRAPMLLSVPPRAAQVVALAIEGCSRIRGCAAILNRDRVREVSQARWVCDPSAAIHEIGFRPLYPAPEGVRATAAWYEKEGWL